MAIAEVQRRYGWPPWQVVVAEVEGLPYFLSSHGFLSHLGNLWWYALCFLHGRNNTAFTALVPGFCSSSSFECIFCLRTTSAMLCFVLHWASIAIVGYSLSALCWKLVSQALAEAMASLGFCCPSEHSCYYPVTACSGFALLAFCGGHCQIYNISQIRCKDLRWSLAFP